MQHTVIEIAHTHVQRLHAVFVHTVELRRLSQCSCMPTLCHIGVACQAEESPTLLLCLALGLCATAEQDRGHHPPALVPAPHPAHHVVQASKARGGEVFVVRVHLET